MVDPDLGSSPEPYSPIIVEKRVEGTPFTPTFIEWLWRKGNQIILSGGLPSIGAITNVFNVPKGKIFLITHLHADGDMVSPPGVGDGIIIFRINSNAGDASFGSLRMHPNVHEIFSTNFNPPIILDEENTLDIEDSGAGIAGRYAIIGFVVDKTLLSTLI